MKTKERRAEIRKLLQREPLINRSVITKSFGLNGHTIDLAISRDQLQPALLYSGRGSVRRDLFFLRDVESFIKEHRS